MRMDDMNDLFVARGFTVERKWIAEQDAYRFVISKDKYCHAGIYKYPVGVDGKTASEHQREFVKRMIKEFYRYYSNAIYGASLHPINLDECARYCELDVKMTQELYKMGNWLNANIKIKNVIFNDPATIVFWTDGTKTVVKCQDGDIYDPEKGLAMAISKKALGNKGNYCNEIKKWLPKEEEQIPHLHEIKIPELNKPVSYFQKKIYEAFGLKKDTKLECVQKAYNILVAGRDNEDVWDIDEVIGYLGEALED